MGKYLRKFDTHSEYEEYINSQDKLLPNVSYCEDQKELHYNKKPHDYSQDYLTFVALEDGTFTFTPTSSNVISYSTDNGGTWTQGNSVSVNSDDKVLWKGTMTPSQGIGTFSSTANFDVEGNAMSLLFGDNYKEQTDLTGKNFAFYNLFYDNTKVINAKNLSLSATTLVRYCYTSMFEGCTNLITVPKLPATTLEVSCYNFMFKNCTSLIIAPELPATTLTNGCYSMMFNGCTSLVTAPELPATTLEEYCYTGMFQGCTNLNYIKAMFTTTPSANYTNSWVDGVAATGTFVRNNTAQWYVIGTNGIPEGWEVVPPETKIIATFNVTDTSSATNIMYDGSIIQFSEIEIDGVVQPSVISSYTFSTTGEHIVKYTLTNTLLGVGAFKECDKLTSITIPNIVTSIGSNAFHSCDGLTSVTIGNGVTSIGYKAFEGCYNLTSVNIGTGITSIGDVVFSACSNLTSIVCNATTAPTIQSGTFRNVKTNGTLTVPTGSTGYDVWMDTGDYYLGKYSWTKIEQ